MIAFHLDSRSGVSPYLQIVQQVKQALRLGTLQPGDQLPTLREVVGQLAINPNTVLKAYRELENAGLVDSRPGLGTFVGRGVPAVSPGQHAALQRSLRRWLGEARGAGLDDESILALFAAALRESQLAERHEEHTA
jgi:GntR family transcriptional regulator